MKRFLAISLTLIALCTHAWACGGEFNNHNSYLFSVIHRNLMDNDAFTSRMNQFWKTYSNGKVDQYHWNEEELLNIAKKKGDNEMVSYLNSLNTYIAICDQLRETWSYPTKEELAQRKRDLNGMITKYNAYKGTRLKPQWTLLAMRANMVLGNHTQNINLWKQKASKLPESVYRDMARNIYAGALLHMGQRTEACNIYAEQGDMVSIKWAMRKHRNLAGIKAIMAENPQSTAINFLVQDFVNNTQETIDNGGDKDAADWIDSRIILRNEAMNFITYAREVVDTKKTTTPALWLAAIGEIQYLFGMYDDAMTTLNQAVDANGTQRMKDNARAIRMVVAGKSANLDSQFSQWMTNELQWLEGRIKDGEGTTTGFNDFDYHYVDVLDRLVFSISCSSTWQKTRPCSVSREATSLHGIPTTAPNSSCTSTRCSPTGWKVLMGVSAKPATTPCLTMRRRASNSTTTSSTTSSERNTSRRANLPRHSPSSTRCLPTSMRH